MFHIILTLILIFNALMIKSSFLGVVLFIIYLLLLGKQLGVIITKNSQLSILFGSLFILVIFGFFNWFTMIFYKLGEVEVVSSLIATTIIIKIITNKSTNGKNNITVKNYHHSKFINNLNYSLKSLWKDRIYIRIIEASLIMGMIFIIYLLLKSRNSISLSIWQYMDVRLLPMIFINTILLIFILFSNENKNVKLSLLILFSVLLHSFFLLVFKGGYGTDQWLHLGFTQRVYDIISYPQNVFFHFSGISPQNLLLKIYLSMRYTFQYSLIVGISRISSLDVYSVHMWVIPIIWSIFIPSLSLGVVELFMKNEKTEFLAGFLTLSIPSLIIWGAVSVPNSLSWVFFLFTFYILLRFQYSGNRKYLLIASVIALASLLTHFLSGVISLSLLLLSYSYEKITLMRNEKIKKLSIVLILVLCTSFLPLILLSSRIAYPALLGSSLTLDLIKSLSLDKMFFTLLMGEYVNMTGDKIILSSLIPIFALYELIHLSLSTRVDNTRKKKMVYFALISFLIILLDYLIIKNFMINVNFGKERIWVFRDLISTSFAAMAITRIASRFFNYEYSLIFFFKQSLTSYKLSFKKIFSFLFIISLVAPLITVSVYVAYPQAQAKYQGVNSLELDAARWIDSHSNEPYLVLGYSRFFLAGYAIKGIANPTGYYPYKYNAFLNKLNNELRLEPFRTHIILNKASRYSNNASLIYLVLSDSQSHQWVKSIINSPYFQLVKKFTDIKIYRYKFTERNNSSVHLLSVNNISQRLSTYTVNSSTDELHYVLKVQGQKEYNITNFPSSWSYECINPQPQHISINANSWINFTGLSDIEYRIVWHKKEYVDQILWKDDSFMEGWYIYQASRELSSPIMHSDGDILSLSSNFTNGRQYYWLSKNLNLSLPDGAWISIRWKSTSSVGISWIYYNDMTGDALLNYASFNEDYTLNTIRIDSEKIIDRILIGLDDFGEDASGNQSIYIDYIMIYK